VSEILILARVFVLLGLIVITPISLGVAAQDKNHPRATPLYQALTCFPPAIEMPPTRHLLASSCTRGGLNSPGAWGLCQDFETAN
jgi:hypothetical protein